MFWFGRIAGPWAARCSAARCSAPLYTPAAPLRCLTRLWCVQVSPGPVLFYSSVPPSADLSVQYKHGRPTISLPLPSRQERCHFLLRPLGMSVNDFLSDIQKEDPGVTTAAVLNSEGEKLSLCTSMDTVLKQNFLLQLNSSVYTVQSAGGDCHEHVTQTEDLKELVLMLHCALQLPAHQLHTHTQLQQRKHTLTLELAPLEQIRAQLAKEAESHATRVTWAGLAFLSLQGGFLAYLTWFVFAWDVMEPVTYFLTYATSIGFLAYYILTKQDLIYPDAKDRQFLHFFHKRAAKRQFNVHQYNLLKKELALVESDLKRLRNPLELKIPVDHIQA